MSGTTITVTLRDTITYTQIKNSQQVVVKYKKKSINYKLGKHDKNRCDQMEES